MDDKIFIYKGGTLSHYEKNRFKPGTIVKVEENITEIDESAFFLSDIKEVQLHDKVEKIGSGAFLYCTKLETINFPKGLKTIGDKSFVACTSLKSIQLPEGLRKIGKDAFVNCRLLEKVEGYWEGVLEIHHRTDVGESAFYGTRLSELHARDNYIIRGMNDDAKNTKDYLEYETYASALVKVVNTIEGSGANAAIGL